MEYKVILVSIDNMLGLLRWLILFALIVFTIILFLNRKAKTPQRDGQREEKKSWLAMAIITIIAAPFLILQIIGIEKPIAVTPVPENIPKNESDDSTPTIPDIEIDDNKTEPNESSSDDGQNRNSGNGNTNRSDNSKKSSGSSSSDSGEKKSDSSSDGNEKPAEPDKPSEPDQPDQPDEPDEPVETKYRLTITDVTIVSPESSDQYLPGTEITVTPNDKPGYHFDHWSSDAADLQNKTESPLTFEMPEGDLTLSPHYEPNTNTPYVVLYRQMQFAENDYQTYETYNGTGTTGQEITPEVREYAGFNKPSAQTTTISANGDTVVTYDYVRQKRSFTLMNPAYITSSHESGDHYYGTEITVSAREKQGYHFVKWNNDQTSETITINLTTDTTIEAIYDPNTDTPYKVEYKQMNIDGDNYVTYETYDGSGTSDSQITPEVRNYTGFKSPDPQTTTISPSGKTVVTYRYDRIKRHFEITDREHIVAGSAEDGDYYYGKTITVTAEQIEDYDLTWSDGSTDYVRTITIGTEDISLTPVYMEVSGINVNVIHQKANIGGGYTTADTETLTVKPGRSITPATKNYKGFTAT